MAYNDSKTNLHLLLLFFSKFDFKKSDAFKPLLVQLMMKADLDANIFNNHLAVLLKLKHDAHYEQLLNKFLQELQYVQLGFEQLKLLATNLVTAETAELII